MKSEKILPNMFVYLTIFVFMAFSVYAAQQPVNLGTAGNFVILTKSGISTTGTTSITGDIGVSPIDSTAITGFGLIADSSNQFSTSSIVTGKVYAADYAPPTPTTMTTAVSDMETAYTDAAGRTLPDATELGAGDITSMTLSPGLYKWGTGVLISAAGVTLSGGSNDVWIFQIAQDLNVGNGAIITLSGGAQAKNIFWQVAGQATLGTTSDVKGIILSQTAIAMNTGAKLNGRALAQTAVTLDADAVTAPTGSATPTPSPTPTPSTSNGTNSSGGISESTPSTTPTSNPSSGSSGWQCGEWSTCISEGIQTRTCTQSGDPSVTSKESQSCTYNAPTTATQSSQSPAVNTAAPTTPAVTEPAAAPIQSPAPATNTAAPTIPAVTEPIPAAQSKFAALKDSAIKDLKNPKVWMGIGIVVLVLAGLYAGYYYMYKKK